MYVDKKTFLNAVFNQSDGKYVQYRGNSFCSLFYFAVKKTQLNV